MIMTSDVDKMREIINIVEYKMEVSQDDEPILSDGQKRLVKALYETDIFSIDNAIIDLRKMNHWVNKISSEMKTNPIFSVKYVEAKIADIVA